MSHGQPTERVRDFVVEAYVRGAKCGCADRSGFENSTAVFTKRRCCKVSDGRRGALGGHHTWSQHPNEPTRSSSRKRVNTRGRVTMHTLCGASALYRDAWNRNIVRRIGRTHNHTLKIKARVRAKGQRGSNWYGEKRVEYLRRKCRTSNLWLLQLSGDFHPSFETEPIVDLEKHHMMRTMLTANLAVDQRFANGCGLNTPRCD